MRAQQRIYFLICLAVIIIAASHQDQDHNMSVYVYGRHHLHPLHCFVVFWCDITIYTRQQLLPDQSRRQRQSNQKRSGLENARDKKWIGHKSCTALLTVEYGSKL